MAPRNISISKEAFNALLHEKKNGESLSQTILRITKRTGKLSDSFGAWEMTDPEEQAVLGELSEGWRHRQITC